MPVAFAPWTAVVVELNRDPFEVIVIKALVVAVTAGSAAALADLTKKLK